jgi:hypothetical protein
VQTGERARQTGERDLRGPAQHPQARGRTRATLCSTRKPVIISGKPMSSSRTILGTIRKLVRTT